MHTQNRNIYAFSNKHLKYHVLRLPLFILLLRIPCCVFYPQFQGDLSATLVCPTDAIRTCSDVPRLLTIELSSICKLKSAVHRFPKDLHLFECPSWYALTGPLCYHSLEIRPWMFHSRSMVRQERMKLLDGFLRRVHMLTTLQQPRLQRLEPISSN